MEPGIILFTLGVYGLAVYLGWRDRAPNYVIALVAGHISALPSPLWQMLYGFRYNERFPSVYEWLIQLPRIATESHTLPRPIFLAAWTIMLPPLLIFYLFRRNWWFASYATVALTYAVFVIYHATVETIGIGAGWWAYAARPASPLNISLPIQAGLMNGLVSIGALAALLFTRRYSFTSLLVFLVPVPLVLSILVHGVLGAPLYATRLLEAQTWVGLIGMVGTLTLILAGAHIVASSLAYERE